ncbi:MAG: hypothetical protein LLG01_15770 [Planctomycetaceae bacterium]|nr:hypothetical protein [Planctomycetaceae bacterium]
MYEFLTARKPKALLPAPAPPAVPAFPMPAPVTLLRYCRCTDCQKFFNSAGQYYCADYIGGTKVVWGTGERFCDPPPDSWHYCAGYDGPLISKEVMAWPKGQERSSDGWT